jgi:hypothetical protein
MIGTALRGRRGERVLWLVFLTTAISVAVFTPIASAHGGASRMAPVSAVSLSSPAGAFASLSLRAPATLASTTFTVTTDQGPTYNIPPAPKNSAGKALLITAAETLQTLGNAAIGVGVTGLIANGLASAGIITLPATVPGAAVSGIILGAGVVVSMTGGFLKNWLKDPADFNFTQIATPRTITFKPLTSSNRLLKPIDTAQNKLTAAVVEGVALSQAFVTSVDRADGARVRHNGFWQKRQTGVAVGYAHQAAKLLKRLPGLQRGVQNAFQAAGISAVISQQKLDAAVKALKTGAAKAKLKTQLKRLGLSSFYGLIYHAIATIKPPSYGLDFPQILNDPSLVKQEQRAATVLGGYNGATILQIIKASH